MQLVVLPPVHELQRGDDTRYCWINYSAFDAKSTYDLYQRLREELLVMKATLDPAVQADYAKVGRATLLCLPCDVLIYYTAEVPNEGPVKGP